MGGSGPPGWIIGPVPTPLSRDELVVRLTYCHCELDCNILQEVTSIRNREHRRVWCRPIIERWIASNGTSDAGDGSHDQPLQIQPQKSEEEATVFPICLAVIVEDGEGTTYLPRRTPPWGGLPLLAAHIHRCFQACVWTYFEFDEALPLSLLCNWGAGTNRTVVVERQRGGVAKKCLSPESRGRGTHRYTYSPADDTKWCYFSFPCCWRRHAVTEIWRYLGMHLLWWIRE